MFLFFAGPVAAETNHRVPQGRAISLTCNPTQTDLLLKSCIQNRKQAPERGNEPHVGTLSPSIPHHLRPGGTMTRDRNEK